MLHANIVNTPVALAADILFGNIKPQTVTLLQAKTGSGKSLVSAIEVQQRLGGHVLLLVPSTDVARTNARLIAEFSGLGWKLGREVGYCAGGKHMRGSHVTVATYGAYLVRTDLRKVRKVAAILDESHVEQWQVEVARADILLELSSSTLFVMETSATMDIEKLHNYWVEGGERVVHQHKLAGSGTAFNGELIERRVPYGAQTNQTCVDSIVERLVAGDRFIMVTQPGMFEVETCANLFIQQFQESDCGQLPDDIAVYTYHGDTDMEEVKAMLAPLELGECRVIVTTPRLLTGMNIVGLDTIITDGEAKYPESDANGSFRLRRLPMSQDELTQALGRVGRTQDGQLILCSSTPFTARAKVMVPEVVRNSSLTLALALYALGRDPLSIKFCNQPRDLESSIARLSELKLVDKGRITKLGRQAYGLEMRPDLAAFLLNVCNNPTTTARSLSLAVVKAAVAEVGNVTKRNQSTAYDDLTELMSDTSSDIMNQVERTLFAVQLNNKERKDHAWLSRRALSRIKGRIYSTICKLQDKRLDAFFAGIFEKDHDKEVKDKSKKGKLKGKTKIIRASPSSDAWKRIGSALWEDQGERSLLLSHWIRMMGHTRLYFVHDPARGRSLEGHSLDGSATGIERFTDVELCDGDYILATPKVIEPRHGGPAFTVLANITKVSPEALVDALPLIFSIRENVTVINDQGRIVNLEQVLCVDNVPLWVEPVPDEDDWDEDPFEVIDELFAGM